VIKLLVLVQVAMVLQERIMDEQDSDLASLHGYHGPSQGRESSKIPGVIGICCTISVINTGLSQQY
jgi:hypothetical protein